MSAKLIVFAAVVAVTRAGILGYSAAPAVATYSSAPAVSYSSVSSPVATYSAAPTYANVAAPSPVAYAAPIAKEIYSDAPANYEFGYSINDPHTGDSKSQQETRHGDAVHGSYSLIEADGSKRIVEYTADAHSGFNAVVHREPGTVAVKSVVPAVVKVAAPIAYAAHSYTPSVAKYSAGPAVSYSSISAPIAAAPAYYH